MRRDVCICGTVNAELGRCCAWVRAHLLQRNEPGAKWVHVPAEPKETVRSKNKVKYAKQQILKLRRAVVLAHFERVKDYQEKSSTKHCVAGWHYHPLILAVDGEAELVSGVISLELANALGRAG